MLDYKNKILEGIHGALGRTTVPTSFCPSAALAADNTFRTPTGPTYSRIVDNVAGGPAVFPLFVFIVEAPALRQGSVSIYSSY